MPPTGLLKVQKVHPLPGNSDSETLKPTLKIDFLKTNLPDDWDISQNLKSSGIRLWKSLCRELPDSLHTLCGFPVTDLGSVSGVRQKANLGVTD